MPQRSQLPASSAPSTEQFGFHRRRFTGLVSLALVGELDLASAPIADAELRDASADAEVVLLDLSGLSFMDCAGLRVLLAADARLREASGRLVIINSSRYVRRLLDLTGTSERFDMAWDPGTPAPASVGDAASVSPAFGTIDAR